MPAVRGFDFMNYRAGGLGWDDECAERVIDWYNEKEVYLLYVGTGFLLRYWETGDGSFYTEYTSFSISKALNQEQLKMKLYLLILILWHKN